MKKSILAAICWLCALAGPPLAAQQRFELAVDHLHTLRNCRGTLVISPDGVVYRTEHKEDGRQWHFADIQSIKVVAPDTIEIFTYEDQPWMFGRDRIWKFRLLQGEIPAEVSALLVEKASRPAVTNLTVGGAAPPLFTIPVKHRHRLGGCDGTLKIFPDRVVYESADVPKDSRSWLYSDLDGFAHYERFLLELITYEHAQGTATRTYDFELKTDLPPQAEAYIRARLKEAADRLAGR
jgi:hypothetical protein